MPVYDIIKYSDNCSYILDKTLVICIILIRCCDNNDRIFKEKENIEILKTPGLIG